MMPGYTLRQLECFTAVADHGSIHAAATALFASESAVSAAVTALEEAMGAQLLVRRKAHGAALTPSGRYVADHARALLAQAGDLQLHAADAAAVLRGRVSVGCYGTLAPTLLSALVDGFVRRHPDVEVDFVHGDQPSILEAVESGRADLAIAYDLSLGSQLQRLPLYTAHANVVLSPEHPLAAQERLGLRELAEHPMIMLDVAPSRDNTMRMFAAAGLVPRVRFRTTDFEVTRSLVGRGLGWSVLIQAPAGNLSYEGKPLRVRPLDEDAAGVPVSLVWSAQRRLSQAAQAMAALARELFGGPPA
jgi:DNA-binding transcriptional LysR family regulator